MEPTPPGPVAPTSSGGRIARIARIAAIPALIGAFIGVGGIDLFVSQDPHEQATEDAGLRMMDLPGFEERFGDLNDDAAFTQGVALGLEAIPHLTDVELDEYLTVNREVLDALDEEACAMFVRGPEDADSTAEAMKAIDIETYRRLLDLLVSGASRELSGASPPPVPAQADYDAALGLLVEQLGVDRLDEIGIALSDPAAPDSELCGALRDFFDAVAELDRDARLTLLRSILGSADPT